MRILLIALLIFSSFTASGQDKYTQVHFNDLTEVKGTAYVIASIENRGKIAIENKHLLFINTTDGTAKQIDLPKQTKVASIKQIQVEELGINKIILVAKTVNLNGDKTINWNDPTQIFILSPDGEQKTQLTADNFFISTWTTNETTGCIVITGYQDSNANRKHDKTDENQIFIYDLKTLKLVAQL